jgi:hypothetical protein
VTPPSRLHRHVADYSVLMGDYHEGWRGDGCPPECDETIEPPAWSTGVPDGREGILPSRPRVVELAHRDRAATGAPEDDFATIRGCRHARDGRPDDVERP